MRVPKGWLVDLLNRFGHHGGFQKLIGRFKQETEAATAQETPPPASGG